MIRYDFQNGIVKRIPWLLLPVAIFIILIFSLASTVSYINNNGQITLGECLVFFLQGSIPAGSDIGSSRPNFYWLLLQLGCIFYTIEYPVRDLNIWGQQIFVRGKNRLRWWLSKCLWMAENVLIYWLVGITVTAIAAPFMGIESTLLIKQSSVMKILNFCNVGFDEYSLPLVLILLVLIPWLSMLAINMICMLVSLLSNQLVSLIVGMAVLFIPSQWMNPIIITNYTMLQRCSLFYSDGLDFVKGILYSITTIVITLILGAFTIQNKDIIEPKKNGEE